MMKVLMKKILFKKRIYTVYTKYIIRYIIPLYYRILYHAKGNKLKKKKVMFAQIHRACISTASPHPFPIQLILQCDEKAST